MPKRISPDGYKTIPDAAKEIGISRSTLYNWILVQRRAHYIMRTSGRMKFYLIKDEDVERLKRSDQTKVGKRYSFYEIVVISLGELTVLFQTRNLRQLSQKYIHMMEHEHKLIRIRADGKLLTIHESDELGNSYHPRTKARYA